VPNNQTADALAFVWPPGALDRLDISALQRTGIRTIVDLTHDAPGRWQADILAGRATEVLVTQNQFMGPSLEEFLAVAEVRTLWVQGFPRPPEPREFADRAGALSNQCRVIPVTGDPRLVQELLSPDSPWAAVALKGVEAAGWVGPETTSVLYSAAETRGAERDHAPALAVWGGVATPEAAAAFLATGAEVVVMESLHWLTDEADLPGDLARRLAALRLDHTRLVGSAVGATLRVFDKGNSTAARRLDELAAALALEPDRQAAAGDFVRQASADLVHPWQSRLERGELIPLGPEAAFAAEFRQRFGRRFATAARAFAAETARLTEQAPATSRRLQDGPGARALGAPYAIIQGGMSWISDRVAFARAVAEAGGVPTIALGMMDRPALERTLGDLPRALDGRPYALNVITLPENPHRDEQLQFILDTKPPLAVIAAGEPAHAATLTAAGIEVIYLAPEPGLLRLAREAGIKWIVLEGYEAGGHVGAHSTLTLAQAALSLRRREPGLFNSAHIVLAGGIHHRPSAVRALMLGADAVQMGTAYLATSEIVDSGALSKLYQQKILAAGIGDTTITGESVGLRVRSLRTPKIQAIAELERQAAGGAMDESVLRRRLETLGAASLLIAARGVDRPAGRALDHDTCRREGQFMAGAAAGAIGQVTTVARLHKSVAEEPINLRQMPRPPARAARAGRAPAGGPAAQERIAITGMALSNALGNDPAEVWQACIGLASGVVEVPPERWDHSRFFDPTPMTPEKTYCKVGAFQNLQIARKDLGIPPQDYRTMTGATRLTMWLAHRALADSGLLDSDVDRGRVGVLISQNSGEAAGTLREMIIRSSADSIVDDLRQVLGLSPQQAEAAVEAIKGGKMMVDDTTLLGRLNCAAGGFICNKYGLRGPSFSVSAACATSLVALFNAVNLVRRGVLDAAVVGGGEEPLNPAHYLEFGALGALAGLSRNGGEPAGFSRPFDRTRDGMVLGEGGGMIIIERESLAKRRGAAVHAYITGMGASNNDQGMVESVAENQRPAMAASFADAGYGPDQIDLVECHATSTTQGDIEEVKALKAFYPQGQAPVLASFKSQIGHTLGASGINSLIRSVCALQAGLFPPTLNYQDPDPQMDLEGWGFTVLPAAREWPVVDSRSRRLQVNAFGFGGANYVVQVEESISARGRMSTAAAAATPSEPAGAATLVEPPAHLIDGVHLFSTVIEKQPHRLAVVAEDQDQARKIIGELEAPAAGLRPKVRRAWARRGVQAAPEAPPAPLAFVFAGQGSQYQGMSRQLYQEFETIRRAMDATAEVAEFDILDLLFNSTEEDLQKTRWQQPALFTMEYAIVRYLMSLGAEPAAMAGHSLGELVALCVAGVFSPADGFRLVNQRALCMDKASSLAADPGAMLAVNAPMELLEQMVAASDELYFTNYNSPRQIVIGGHSQAIDALQAELAAQDYWNARLKVSMAFHSPIMKVIRAEMSEFIDSLEFHPPSIPVISNTTQEPFPDDPEQIKRIVMAHLEAPVHWMQNVRTLAEDFGVGLFVEVGPKDSISNLVADTIDGAEVLHTCHPDDETGVFRAAAARLWCLGHLEAPGRLEQVTLKPGRSKQEMTRQVLQREINAFVQQNLDGSLAEALLRAVQDEVDPNLSGDELGRLLGGGLSLNPPPAATPDRQADAGDPQEGDILERVIVLLMEATGYERDEIEPDMLIRDDLAIRSSRLPVIMNAAEQTFGITIRLEDFIEVRTVRDLAEKVAMVAQRDGAAPPPGGGAPAVARLEDRAPQARPQAEAPSEDLARYVFGWSSLVPGQVAPLPLGGGEVALLGREGSSLARRVGAWLTGELGVKLLEHSVVGRGPEAWTRAAEHLAGASSLAGLVLVLEEATDPQVLLPGYFRVLKSLTRSAARRLVLAVTTVAGAAAEGVLGMHLAASHEYASVLWRCLDLQDGADLPAALAAALDPEIKEVQLAAAGDGLAAAELQPRTAAADRGAGLPLGPEDLVVLSGGGRGITPFIAQALAPTGCKLALLGRTDLDPGQSPYQEAAREVAENLSRLQAMGCRTGYFACDVADPDQVAATLQRVRAELGPITGLVHGAGLLADSYLEFMSPEDFALPLAVKYGGAANLVDAAGDELRWVVGLSSVAAAQGNPGQVNYCAANRAMAGFIGQAAAERGLTGRVFWLPPIEGAGMADDPELRELMKLRDMDRAFLRVEEAAGWLVRELLAGPSDQAWVMPVRHLPAVEALRLEPATERAPRVAAGLEYRRSRLPMIDGIDALDLAACDLRAHRVFSHQRDLWLADHRPFEFLRHPLVSGVMAVETMLEAAAVLMPHLAPVGVDQVRYLDILEVPADIKRRADIHARLERQTAGRTECRVQIDSAFISPTGRQVDRRDVNFTGRVILAPGPTEPEDWPGFTVLPGELDTRPMDTDEVIERYQKRTTMTGRYRVIHTLDGTGEGVISGQARYPEANDIAGLDGAPYLYPVYLLEALSQIVNFYLMMREDDQSRLMIPVAVGAMRFKRACRPGQRVRLEARLVQRRDDGYTWDARAVDDTGRPLLTAKGLALNWYG